MGGLMRAAHHHHHHQGYSSSNNGIISSRGRSYGIMLLVVAFGAALLIGGIMFLQRIKERRIFNLVIKEKENQLASFHLLLQKEKEHTKDAKWKLADMRAKMNTIRAQKRELDNRISEMQSTISSLRDEQRLIELSLEDKQNEIKVLRDKQNEINDEASRVIALSEILKNKESEINDLKHQLESFNIASSNQQIKVTERDETRHEKSDEADNSGSDTNNESAGNQIREHARDYRGDEKRVKGGYNEEPFGEKKPEISEESGVENRRANISLVEKNVIDKAQSDEHEKVALETKDDNGVLRHGDEEHVKENEGLETTGSDSSDQTSIAHDHEKQVGLYNEGGNKLETSTAHDHEKQVGLNDEGGNKLETSTVHDHEKQVVLNNEDGNKLESSTTHDHEGGNKLESPHNFQNSGSSKNTITNGKKFTYRKWKNKGISESNGGVAMRNSRTFPVTEKQQTLDREEAHDSEDPSMKTTPYTLQQREGSNQTVNEETVMQHHEMQTDVADNEKQNNAETNQNIPEGNELLPSHDTSGEGEDLKKQANNKSTSMHLDQREILTDRNRSTQLVDAPIKDMSLNMTIPKHVSKEESMETRLTVQNEGEAQNQESREDISKVQNKEMQNQANGIQELVEKIDDHKDDNLSEQTNEGETDEDSIDPETEDLQQAESKNEIYKDSANDDSDSEDEEYRDF